MNKQVTEKDIENALKPSKVRAFFTKHLTSKFKKSDGECCAIARYLRDAFKVGPSKVHVDGFTAEVKGVEVGIPEWVDSFI